MDIKYLILIANVIFCLVSSLALSAYVRNHDANKRPACLISCIYFAFFAAVSATVYFLPRFYDFTTDVHARYFILPAAAFMLLAAISLVVKHRLFFPLAALLLAVTVVFGLPDFHITFAAVLPLWLNRVLTVFLWLAAAFSLRLFNANDGLVAIETLGISFGIFILSLIGALPFFSRLLQP